ncbi:MAG: cyclic nucleotide-binding domain-containing protein [Gammaproteobacteria bacterium]|nr:cyclic nucleotide-binding domain-containing protein [Gammaproteobacteria bacterium]
MEGTAFLWGIISAASLPLGAVLGLWFQPRRKINSAFMAFGAGALLFALTIELFGHVPHYVQEHGMTSLLATFIGAISGGLLFDSLNNMLNNRGAFLRRFSHARKFVANLKLKRSKKLIEELSRINLFNRMTPGEMAGLIRKMDQKTFYSGETIFLQGDEAHETFFIVDGNVDIVLHENGNKKKLATLGCHETFGEMGVLSGFPRSADAIAHSNVRVYSLQEQDFQDLIEENTAVKQAVKDLAYARLDDFSLKSSDNYSEKWREETLSHLESNTLSVTNDEIMKEGQAISHGNAALAIWLGILIDSVPESFVIGMLAISPAGISLAFIAGVFLANMPEAMSSAVSMKASGMSLKKIHLMWGSICLLTGVGAAAGAVIFPPDPVGWMFYFVVGIEALAAGAMLTMIAETMLPEAFEQGGSIVGLSTLGGFLAALAIKVMW